MFNVHTDNKEIKIGTKKIGISSKIHILRTINLARWKPDSRNQIENLSRMGGFQQTMLTEKSNTKLSKKETFQPVRLTIT